MPTPPNGLASNSNYFLYSDTPILSFLVNIDVTEDIISDVGFGFQLNCWSPVGPTCQWQQYVLAMSDSIQLEWMVQNWNDDMSVNCVNAGQTPWVPLLKANTIPSGWKLTIALSTNTTPDADVVGVTFVVRDEHGNVLGNTQQDFKNLTKDNEHVQSPVTPGDMAPIRAVQLTLVGPGTTSAGPLQFGSTRLTSGAGTFTYMAETSMTAMGTLPAGTTGFNLPQPGSSLATGEAANSSYSVMAEGSATSQTQSFAFLPPPEQVAALDPSGHPHEFVSSDGNAFQQSDILPTGATVAAYGASMCGYQWPETLSKMVVYVDASDHVNELSKSPTSNWEHADLTGITSAPQAAAGSSLSGYSWAVGNSKQVVYLDPAGHVHELFIARGDKKWGPADLTSLTKGTPARVIGVSPLSGYEWPAGQSKQVVYFDANGLVNELAIQSGGQWGHANLSAMTAAPPAAAGSSLSGYSWAGGKSKQVVYLDGAGHVHELYIVAGGKWAHADLTAITGAPPATAGSPLSGYSWTAGDSKQVVYLDSAGHVHELYIVAGGKWAHGDLTAITGAPPAGGSSRLTGYQWVNGQAKCVSYQGGDDHLHLLRVTPGGNWNHLDLTTASGAPPLAAGSPLSGYGWMADIP